MKHKLILNLAALLGVALTLQLHAQTTAFTYQGQLGDNGSPASGSYDLQFTIYDSSGGLTVKGGPLTNSPTTVSNGLFTVMLDFGAGVFDGSERWLEIGAATNGGGAFSVLSPRQPITSTPYALRSANAAVASSVAAGNITGQLVGSQLADDSVTSAKIAVNTITAADLATDSVGATEIAAGAVGTSEIADGSIATNDLSAAVLNSTFWNLNGNVGTTPGTHFLGTTDSQPLELKVNNEHGLRLEYPPTGTVPNLVGGYSGNSVGAGTQGAVIAAGGGNGGEENTIGDNSAFSAISGGRQNQILTGADHAVIGGGQLNVVGTNSYHAAIAGGDQNEIHGSDHAAIGGGYQNTILDQAHRATIGGGNGNLIQPDGTDSTIGGGANNVIQTAGDTSTISGGRANIVGTNADYATIGGGWNNRASVDADYAAIPGGRDNTAASYAFAAGRRAKASHTGAFVWADSLNADFASTSSNQFLIRASGGVAIGTNDPTGAMLRVAGSIKADSFLGMGAALMLGTTDNQPLQLKVNNQVGLRLEYPTGGYVPNLISGYSANSVGSGTEGAVIAGGGLSGFENMIGADSDHSVIGGGYGNSIADNSPQATIAGGWNNFIGTNSDISTIGGGNDNSIADNSFQATIAGGYNNDIGTISSRSAIGGGVFNKIAGNSQNSTIAGGNGNEIGTNSTSSTIGGGEANNIADNSIRATISGGVLNDIGASADNSAIGGGYDNNISPNAQYAVIPGGFLNAVGPGANYALAAGRRAKANQPGTFVWADSQDADFASTSSNQFLIRASGGVGIGTTNPGATVTISRPVQAAAHQLELRNEGSIQSPNFDGIRFTQDADGGTELASITVKYFNTGKPDLSFSVRDLPDTLFIHGNHNNRGGNVGIGTTTPTNKLDVVGNVSATSFITTSDRNAKENFKPVSPQQVLAKVVALPISQWNFKTDTDTPHMGPMAQDFYAAFGVGPDEKHIATVDADGVALAAIQGLNQKLESENAALRQELQELKRLITTLTEKGIRP